MAAKAVETPSYCGLQGGSIDAGDCINLRGAQRGDPAWTLCSQKQAFPEASALQTSHVPLLRSLTAITAVTGEELTYNDVHGSMNFYTGTYLCGTTQMMGVFSAPRSLASDPSGQHQHSPSREPRSNFSHQRGGLPPV